MEVILFVLGIICFFYFRGALKVTRLRTDTLEKSVVRLDAQVRELTRRLAQTGTAPTFDDLPDTAAATPTPAPQPAAPPKPVTVPEPASVPVAVPAQAVPSQPVPPLPTTPQPRPAPAPAPQPAPAWLLAAKNWLFSGNLVAKLGLLILFIGVSFLMKYAAERNILPIELRLAGIVIADIALLVWGWRIRERRSSISLPVQGAALGILMLVTFAAFRMYQLIPGGLAFGLLFVLTAFTCLLAVMQNAIWLAVFGIAGGFLAPIMTSTGQGSHIALFSYYALLNAGILAIALKRAWRPLNLLGFGFTFVIGTAWGVLRYTPEHYLSTQLFLILFLVFYVAIAIAYAVRQAPQLKNYVDATLVFGVPLVAFGLQFGLVKDTQFGVAFSALGLGLFYTVAALAMWRSRMGQSAANFRLLVESFLSLGLVFGTLALPFALDGRWTSAAWALEGAGVVWVGLRQRQALTCAFGLLVQAGAWFSFLGTLTGIDSSMEAVDANLWLGFLLLTGTAFLMATNLRASQDNLPKPLPTWAAGAFLTIAALWLVGGLWTEIVVRTSGLTTFTLLAASSLGASVVLGMIARRMQWRLAQTLALIVQVASSVILLLLSILLVGGQTWIVNLFDSMFLGALIIFAGTIFSAWAMWRLEPDAYNKTSRGMALWSAFWWYGPVLLSLCNWIGTNYRLLSVPGAVSGNHYWVYGIGVALSSIAFAAAARRLAWPFLRWLSSACWIALFLGTLMSLEHLYNRWNLSGEAALSFAVLWLAAEYLLRRWPANGWDIHSAWLKGLHTVRSAGPWLMIWPVAGILIEGWLYGAPGSDQALLAQAGWETSGSWARYVPAWLMMLAIVWLIGRARAGAWPTAPVAPWHRTVLLPLATGWSLLLAAVWNLVQDGAMAPLPYLPVLNPLDLTSAFAVLLAVACYRMWRADSEGASTPALARVPGLIAVAAYAWFNLMLLRTAAQYLGLPYEFEPLFNSQFVQAMLSLVWSVSALVLMWRAARHVSRPQWIVGAVLLALVVGKLFLVDLSNVGGVARIISFVGVGLLMVLIGYIAPFPTQHEPEGAARAA